MILRLGRFVVDLPLGRTHLAGRTVQKQCCIRISRIFGLFFYCMVEFEPLDPSASDRPNPFDSERLGRIVQPWYRWYAKRQQMTLRTITSGANVHYVQYSTVEALITHTPSEGSGVLNLDLWGTEKSEGHQQQAN